MKRIISVVLALLMITPCAFAREITTEYFADASNELLTLSSKEIPTLENGSVIIEGEDMDFSEDAKIIADSDASGGYALTCAKKKYANAPEEVQNVTMSLKINVPESQMGRYHLWCRLEAPKGGRSYFESMTGHSEYQIRWFSAYPESGYFWIKLSTLGLRDGIFEYNIKYRDYAFKLDKFILTDNGDFSPPKKMTFPKKKSPLLLFLLSLLPKMFTPGCFLGRKTSQRLRKMQSIPSFQQYMPKSRKEHFSRWIAICRIMAE